MIEKKRRKEDDVLHLFNVPLFVARPSPMSYCAVQEEPLGSGSVRPHTCTFDSTSSCVSFTGPFGGQDLNKIKWGTQRFILDGHFHKRNPRGRRSWIYLGTLHGHFLRHLLNVRPINNNKAETWSCSICDRRGTPQVFICQHFVLDIPPEQNQ